MLRPVAVDGDRSSGLRSPENFTQTFLRATLAHFLPYDFGF
jgi:hypothetical protein